MTPDTLESDDVGRWNNYQFEGLWRVGATAGGCRNNAGWTETAPHVRATGSVCGLTSLCVPATFPSNPQYVVRLEHVDDDHLDGKAGCTFLVGLMQKGGRQLRRLNQDLESIGFAIYKVSITML